jgi:hypothetical protein
MPWNIERHGVFYDKEILVYPTGMEASKNIVIDATTVPIVLDADGNPRYVVEAGTVLVKIEASTKVAPALETAEAGKKPAKEVEGLEAKDIVGIMHHTVEFFGVASSDYDEAGAAFFHTCIFDSTKLLGYTKNIAAVKAALPSCEFQ